MRYVSVRPNQEPLRSRIREIAAVRVSYGYRRVHVLLRREGWPINRKRVHRLYREEGLCLRAKRPKRRRMATARQVRPAATEPNQRWAMDFMSDALHNGRRLRVLTVVDTCTPECVVPAFEGASAQCASLCAPASTTDPPRQIWPRAQF
jgi:putative transposase